MPAIPPQDDNNVNDEIEFSTDPTIPQITNPAPLWQYLNQATKEKQKDQQKTKNIINQENESTRDGSSSNNSAQLHQQNLPQVTKSLVNREVSVTKVQWENLVYDVGSNHRVRHLSNSFLHATEMQGPRRQRYRSICYFRMLNPLSKFSRTWTLLTLFVDFLYTGILLPIIIAFGIWTMQPNWAFWIEMCAGIFFIVNMGIGFNTGFIAKYNFQSCIIMNGKKSAMYYVRKGSFFYDFVAIVPMISQIVFYLVKWVGVWVVDAVTICRMLRFTRIIGVMRQAFLSKASVSFKIPFTNFYINFSPVIVHVLGLIYLCFVLANLMGCVAYYIAYREGLGLNTWIGTYGLGEAAEGRQYIVSIYYAVTTMTTVGYGDITPQNGLEQGLAMIIMFTGVLMWSFLVGSLQSLITYESKDARLIASYRQRMGAVENWMKRENLPPDLKGDIKLFYATVWLKSQELVDEQVLKELPADLKNEVTMYLIKDSLKQLDMFQDFDEFQLEMLVSQMEPFVLPPGQELQSEGQDADCIYLVTEGEMHVLRDDEIVEKNSAPSIIGEFALLKDLCKDFEYRAFTYLANSVCSLWKLPIEHLEILMQAEPKLEENIYTGIYNSVKKRYQSILGLQISRKLSLEDVIVHLKRKAEKSQSQLLSHSYQRQSSTWGQLIQSSRSMKQLNEETDESMLQNIPELNIVSQNGDIGCQQQP